MVKLKTAAEEVPALVTLADDPGAPVVVVPAAMVAAVPEGPWPPVAPVAPVWPAGMPKLKTAAEDVPALATVADEPGASVVVVPTAMVAASPWAPGVPSSTERLAGAVARTDRDRLASAPSTSMVRVPSTSEETEMEDMDQFVTWSMTVSRKVSEKKVVPP
jgi:hypothetical protein